MIYCPLSTQQDTPRFQQQLGDGSQWGMSIEYAVQPSPDGLAQASLIGETFLDGAPCALVLGDNVYYGYDFQSWLKAADAQAQGATVFACHDSLLDASQFIATLEKRQGLKLACPEEIAWRSGWIDDAQLQRLAEPLKKNGYGQYLLGLLSSRVF